MISDSLRFVDVTAPMLRQSTPHLYLSALPFIPRDSPLSISYLPAFPGTIDVEDKNSLQWPQMVLNIPTSSENLSIALSPDGKRIVSGSKDRTWSIWDAKTGNPVIGPIRGHTNEITPWRSLGTGNALLLDRMTKP
jgi:WD40 repeat protein